MGLLGRVRKRKQQPEAKPEVQKKPEWQLQLEAYQESLRKEFDKLIRTVRIGQALVDAYNQESGGFLILEEVRFSLVRTADTGEIFIELCTQGNEVLWLVEYSALPGYMPNMSLTVHEVGFLNRYAADLGPA